jgi:hypothetical protein
LPNTKPVSPYHSGGVLPGTKPVSPYHGGGNLPGTSPSACYTNPSYGSTHNEVERKMGDLGIGYPMLPPPEGFSRPPNVAQSHTRFETIKIRDMDDLMESVPRMPVVLGPHDVYHPDWIRFMQDLTKAWLGRLPVPESAKKDGHPPKRLTVTTDLVQRWNASFFVPRGVELIIYKGRERMNGKDAGKADTDLPGFDLTAEDVSDYSSELSQQDSEDEVRDAEARRRERREQKAKRRSRRLEGKYTLYLTCLPVPRHA